MKRRHVAVLAALLHGTWLGTASAQTDPGGSDAKALKRVVPKEDDGDAAIVVTGSRIARKLSETTAPTVVITSDQIRTAGRTQIADLVNQLPALAITQTDQTSNLAGNAGLNALDLRGLGTKRTLVLVDGRRHVPGEPGSSAVDISTIPSNLVERIEVITGGASALYGADAVAGVANFILKKDFQGFDSSFRYGQSTRADMYSRDIDFLAGRNFADGRGNVTAFVSYSSAIGTVSGQDRPWTAGGYPLYIRPSPQQKYQVRDNNYNVVSSPNATVLFNKQLYTFTPDGRPIPAPLGPGGILGTPNLSDPYSIGGMLTDGGNLGGRYDGYYLQTPSDRFASYGALNYELSDTLRFYVEGEFSQNKAYSAALALVGFGGDTVPADSPFITSQIAALNGGTITAPIPFGRRFNDFGDAEILFNRRMYQLSTGLDGSFDLFGRGWKWSAYYTYGKTMVKTRQLDQIAFPRYFNALDSTTGPDGQPACRSTLTDPTNGCVPLNPFIQSVSDAVRRYLQFNTSNALASLDQHVASAYVTGPLFRLPGGDFSVAAGAEYRRESNDIGATPEFDPSNPKYNADYGTVETPLKGKYSVGEVFAEVKAPLLAGQPFFHMLEVEAAVREAHYSTAGYTTTWKFGGEWSPIRDVRFRGTYGQAVRAPNISELFTASSIAGAYVADPCNTYNLRYRADKTQYTAANCALVNPSDKSTYYLYRNIISQGNPDLKVEVARTLTAGIVITPRLLPGLSLSADYYDIKLRNSIDAFPAQTILNRCVDSPTLQNQFCGFVARDSGGNILSVVTQQLNLAKYRNRGIDFAGTYRLALERLGLPARWGSLTIDAAYTRLLTRDYLLDANLPGSALQTVGIFGSPKWKGVVRTSWDIPGANVTWTFRHFGSMRPSTDVTDAQYSPAYTGDVFYNDFSVSKSLNQAISLFAGINNAFDRAPPRIPGAEAGGANFELGYQAGVYDVIGRTIYFGIRFTR